jgi:uncharacterized glyoxalase superfamily protein PhnB
MRPFHKPQGYTTVSPYLVVDGAGRTIEFLQRAFGAVELRRLEAGATSVQEPVKKDDADKRGGVKCPGGATWWIATRLE